MRWNTVFWMTMFIGVVTGLMRLTDAWLKFSLLDLIGIQFQTVLKWPFWLMWTCEVVGWLLITWLFGWLFWKFYRGKRPLIVGMCYGWLVGGLIIGVFWPMLGMSQFFWHWHPQVSIVESCIFIVWGSWIGTSVREISHQNVSDRTLV